MLDSAAKFYPPVPVPQLKPLGPLALLRVLARNPLEAWTNAHFEEPIVMGGLSIGRVALVNDPAAIRRVLMDNAQNYHKDWLQRRVLSAGLSNGLLLTADGHQWRMQRRALAPLFARRTVISFTAAMIDVAAAMVERLKSRDGQIEDMAVEVTRVTLEVLEKTMFSDGLGRSAEEIRVAMKHYFEAIGRLDPFDVLGLPAVVLRLSRWKVRPMLRLFETAIDTIVSTRRRRIAEDPAGVPRDILTLLLEARDPETGEGLSEVEVRANILTFIAAGHETTANSITWSLFLLSQSPEWCSRVQAEADRELDGDIGGLADRLVETRAVIEESNRLYPPSPRSAAPRSGPTNSRASPSGAAPWSSLRPTCCTGITPYGPIPIASIPAASSATRARPSIVLLIFRSALARVSASGPAWPCRRHRSLWRPSCGTSPWNWRRVTWSRQSIG